MNFFNYQTKRMTGEQRTGGVEKNNAELGMYAVRTTRTIQKSNVKKSDIIVNPKFLEAANCIEDSYWSGVLEKNAKDKFPAGFKYQDSNLIYRKGATCDSLFLGDLEGKEFALKCIDFYKRYTRMKSSLEISAQNIETEIKRKEKRNQINSQWTKRMVTNDRIQLVLHYANRLCKELDLDEELSKELKKKLYHATAAREFSSSVVTFKDGEIKNISGVIIDKENKKITLKFPKQKRAETKVKNEELKTLKEKWETFIKICVGEDIEEEEEEETSTMLKTTTMFKSTNVK